MNANKIDFKENDNFQVYSMFVLSLHLFFHKNIADSV